jgi:hypothetical protein
LQETSIAGSDASAGAPGVFGRDKQLNAEALTDLCCPMRRAMAIIRLSPCDDAEHPFTISVDEQVFATDQSRVSDSD